MRKGRGVLMGRHKTRAVTEREKRNLTWFESEDARKCAWCGAPIDTVRDWDYLCADEEACNERRVEQARAL
jgi:hypothetical protein